MIDALRQKIWKPVTELEKLLKMKSQKRKISESELLTWLDKWEEIFLAENQANRDF
ncbi:MAG: hypothetical protein WBA93_34875 [Microcoleaceae cyanobacterium]